MKRELINATRTPIALTQTVATHVDVRLGLQETAFYVKVQLNRALYTFVFVVCLVGFCECILITSLQNVRHDIYLKHF